MVDAVRGEASNHLTINTEPLTVVIPKEHIAMIFGKYLYASEVLTSEENIQYLDVPCDMDDAGNITITVGIAKGLKN